MVVTSEIRPGGIGGGGPHSAAGSTACCVLEFLFVRNEVFATSSSELLEILQRSWRVFISSLDSADKSDLNSAAFNFFSACSYESEQTIVQIQRYTLSGPYSQYSISEQVSRD